MHKEQRRREGGKRVASAGVLSGVIAGTRDDACEGVDGGGNWTTKEVEVMHGQFSRYVALHVVVAIRAAEINTGMTFVYSVTSTQFMNAVYFPQVYSTAVNFRITRYMPVLLLSIVVSEEQFSHDKQPYLRRNHGTVELILDTETDTLLQRNPCTAAYSGPREQCECLKVHHRRVTRSSSSHFSSAVKTH